MTGEEQKTFTFTVFWLGEHCLGFLIQEATVMVPSIRLCSLLIALSWSLSSGENEPSQGTNFITMQYGCFWMLAVEQMQVRSPLSVQYI